MGKRSAPLGLMALCALGCGTLPSSGNSAQDGNEGTTLTRAEGSAPGAPSRLRMGDQAAQHADLRALPEAPWAGRSLPAERVPRELLHAWHGAGNRGRCAPMMPDLVSGVTARSVTLDGGWAVAFDRPGEAGVTADGDPCERCGLSAYGIAGTAATPEDWAHLGPAHLEPRFRDGSSLDVERSEGRALTANIVVNGERCVYQVWTFLGEDHLRDLLAGLRRVAPSGPARVAGVGR